MSTGVTGVGFSLLVASAAAVAWHRNTQRPPRWALLGTGALAAAAAMQSWIALASLPLLALWLLASRASRLNDPGSISAQALLRSPRRWLAGWLVPGPGGTGGGFCRGCNHHRGVVAQRQRRRRAQRPGVCEGGRRRGRRRPVVRLRGVPVAAVELRHRGTDGAAVAAHTAGAGAAGRTHRPPHPCTHRNHTGYGGHVDLRLPAGRMDPPAVELPLAGTGDDRVGVPARRGLPSHGRRAFARQRCGLPGP